MKVLVIHPADPTTNFLKEVYADRNWTVINTVVSGRALKDAIKSHDRIIMMGHGSDKGLFQTTGTPASSSTSPVTRFQVRMIIDSKLVYLLRQKDCIAVWCNADVFMKKYRLPGFHTGMIISEYEEALNFAVPAPGNTIEESNQLFAWALRQSVDYLSHCNILEAKKELYTGISAVIEFNRQNLYAS